MSILIFILFQKKLQNAFRIGLLSLFLITGLIKVALSMFSPNGLTNNIPFVLIISIIVLEIIILSIILSFNRYAAN